MTCRGSFVAFFVVAVLALLLAADARRAELLDSYDPVANPLAVVVAGSARFTVLTERLLRIEYCGSQCVFEDRRTVAVVNRNVPLVNFQVQNNSGVLVLSTKSLVLTYELDRPFSAATLNVKPADSSSTAFRGWSYGDVDSGNLFGTVRTLDESNVVPLNCTVYAQTVPTNTSHCVSGLVSRSGWTVVNDTGAPVLDASDWWLNSSNVDAVDLYLFAHGHDYKGALFDFVQIAGRIAMVPRYMSGVFFTRWYNFNNWLLRQYVDEFIKRELPLDVMILDMNWHMKPGWTGYTFDSRLFPSAADTLDFLQHYGLAVGANLHDADGVGTFEALHDQLARALNAPLDQPIPFACANQTYMRALDDVVLAPLRALGIDLWWIDWQQGETNGGCPGDALNPTITTNMLRSTDPYRHGTPGSVDVPRGLILARWGGLGNHRYQVGFSGDVAELSWSNLAFQPYFSATAANVGFGFWSHDIVGPADDMHLYTRWIQWAALSGSFRMHDRGGSSGDCANTHSCWIVRPWDAPTPFYEAIRGALQLRAELVPYIYTQHRTAFDTGLSLLRPMYYEYPDLDMAYASTPTQPQPNVSAFSQFFFGADMIAAPIVSPPDNATLLAAATVWLPPGSWFEVDAGRLHVVTTTNATLTKNYAVDQVPRFVRGGAVMALRSVAHAARTPVAAPLLGLAARPYDHLKFVVYPGADVGSTVVYDDDGASTAYLGENSGWATTTAQYTRTPTTMSFSVVTDGVFDGMSPTRATELQVLNAAPAATVLVNGASVPFSRWGGEMTWSYEGRTGTLVVECAAAPVATILDIEIQFADLGTTSAAVLNGWAGFTANSNLAKGAFDEVQLTPGSTSATGGALSEFASLGEYLSLVAGSNVTQFAASIASIPAKYQAAVAEVAAMKPSAAHDTNSTDKRDGDPLQPTRWMYGATLLAAASVSVSQ